MRRKASGEVVEVKIVLWKKGRLRTSVRLVISLMFIKQADACHVQIFQHGINRLAIQGEVWREIAQGH
ncbi:hypothetical protein SAMN04488056_104382 [Cohaesibacter marisflavi]|uniref:Uncharacterized protein n=1 Tax=Cohaesibacter marisflavi TaxID=655353 RepID=A0A1I5G6R2_9HYPH|nr:hypothetical protein SAMN04488056_104382 [Cohaesibacter marisflavi]